MALSAHKIIQINSQGIESPTRTGIDRFPDPRARPVFIVGSPRSGTTLLYHMLLSAGNFAIFRTETKAFCTLGPSFGKLEARSDRARMMERFLASDMFALSGLDAETLRTRVIEDCRGTGDFLRILMDSMARQQGARRWAECTPQHALHLREIKKAIPDALFLHIIRDGRDVALSLNKQGWIRALPWDREKQLQVSMLYWEHLVRSARAAARHFPADYHEVRYEGLVQRPQTELNQIGTFLEHELDYQKIQREGIGSVRYPNTSFGKATGSFVDRWKTLLSPAQVKMLEKTSGRLLSTLGYERQFPSSPQTAVRLRASYAAYFSLREWAKNQTPLARFFVTTDILEPGAVIRHTRSQPWLRVDEKTIRRSMGPAPNWVERRAMKERTLHSKSGDVWNEVRASLQDACDSYNQYYCPPLQPFVEHNLESGSRLIVVRTIPAADEVRVIHPVKVTMVVTFKRDEFKIVATRENVSESTFVISSDESRAFLIRNPGSVEATADEVAQLILEPLLFGDSAPNRPTLTPTRGEYMG